LAGPLTGIVVLDLGQVYSGPYCALLLAHLGARIIKVEPPPAGEPLRSRGESQTSGESFNFQLLNGGKESLILDLKDAAGLEAFHQLAGRADVLVENFAPGTTARLGIDYPAVSAVNPRIVYASVKAFAADSVSSGLRGMDLTVQASSGVMSVNGYPDGPPLRCGPSLVDFLGGAHLAMGILAALIERSVTGRGQAIDVALQDAVVPTLASNLSGWLTDPSAPERTGNRHGGMLESPYNTYPAADGWVSVLCLTEAQWRGLCELIGRADLRDDKELATSAGRVARMHMIDEVVGSWIIERTAAAAAEALQRAGVPAARIATLGQLFSDEMARSSPMIQRSNGAGGEATYTFGSPVRLGNHPPRRSGPVPALGQHTAAIMESLRAPSGDAGGLPPGDAGGLAPGAAGDGSAPLPQGGADGR